jgi:hypothetical protein
MNTEKKNFKTRKLSLNRETLRTLSAERLEEVAGGWTPLTDTCNCDTLWIRCGPSAL